MQTIPHSTDELRQEAAQLFTDDNKIFSPDMEHHYVRNRVMNAESGDLSRQLAAYFQKQLDERSDGFPLVRDYSEAVQFYNGFLKKRVKAQLAASKHYPKDARAVVTIPLCLRLRKAITLSETEHFAELSTDGKPMAKYLKERNWGFATACYVEGGRGTSEGKKIMLTGIIYPEIRADTI